MTAGERLVASSNVNVIVYLNFGCYVYVYTLHTALLKCLIDDADESARNTTFKIFEQDV